MTMRTFLLLLPVIALSALGNSQVKPQRVAPAAPKKFKIDPVVAPGQGGWTKSKMTVASMAKKIAAATSSLKNTTAELRIDVITPDGRAIFTSPSVALRVRDSKFYRVDYAAIQMLPFSASLVYDGKNRRMRFDDKVTNDPGYKPLAVATKVKGNRLVSLFDIDFPRLVFQGLTEGVDAWVPVLDGWIRGTDGYKALVEERRLTYKGVKYLNYRIRAERSGAAKRSLGTSSFEVVIDGARFLPVTIRNVRKDLKGGDWSVMWAAMYRFNQTVGAKDIAMGR